MSEVAKKFHETWLGMVQPIEGLVVSVPVLVEAECMARQTPEAQEKLIAACPPTRKGPAGDEGFTIADLRRFFTQTLELTPDLFDAGEELPTELSLYVAEGQQTLRPTLGLKRMGPAPAPSDGAEATPASRAGERYVALVWDLAESDMKGGVGLRLDKPETVTGPWDYPPSAKFDRLLRHCRVPIGILTNRVVVRLLYAPHGESSGHIDFSIEDMVSVGGRPILDAFMMLLSASRFFAVAEDRALPALLAESRKRQANVTNELAEQVFDALQILLRGFEAAAERDGRMLLDDALEREGDHLYKGLLAVLLRLVFLLYAEDRGLMPVEQDLYAKHMSVLALYERLQADHGAHPDSMSRRFGAWGQLIALFRAVFLGVDHGDLRMPPRRGALFDPNLYPFLEGWGPAGGAPVKIAEHRAEVRVPTLDDETVYRVLEKLIVFEGQRLSYRTLDVEQIGSVYEALMGYHVIRVPAPAVCMRPDGLWVTGEEVLEVTAARRAKWLKDTVGLTNPQADKLASSLKDATKPDAAVTELAELAITGKKRDRTLAIAKAGQLVLQPGSERRRTSSHYTPRSLSEPIVKRTIDPLVACMGETPASERLLQLTICDPAMGSGAFLVAACRYLADHVVAAWTREGKLEEIAKIAPNEDPVLFARRLVAQRCLYGVDKNDAAVELAKLSLWLVTLAKDQPFTFLDHALRHGDSLVGLTFDQIRAFHWKPEEQLDFAERALREALDEAIGIRQEIQTLAADPSPEAQREKARLLADAEDACDRARLIGDLVVGAFFAHQKDKDREDERKRRRELVRRWLDGDAIVEPELRAMQEEIRARIPVFHWMLEFPEVFYAERPDPLADARVNRAAHMDAFVGNPPFLGGTRISIVNSPGYRDWIMALHNASGLSDLSAYFFRVCFDLLGANGALGLIATNSIAQGDSRRTSLAWIRQHGGTIYAAIARLPWPGDAAVSVSVVHVCRGTVSPAPELDGKRVARITAFLSPIGGDDDPVPLSANKGIALFGSFVLGIGFVFDDGNADANSLSLMEALVEKDPRNRERIFGYMGGEDINTIPDLAPRRYIIDFGEMDRSEAERWPDLFAIVADRVRPARSSVKQKDRRDLWWLYATRSPLHRRFVEEHRRCLVLSQLSTHLALGFLGPGIVVSHTAITVLIRDATGFAVLQSRIHEPWARFLSSSLEDRLRYTPSDCFETFPFPTAPREVQPELEEAGESLYRLRSEYMLDSGQGLTQAYNNLKDPDCRDQRVASLRSLHEEMDRLVLRAYGWSDLAVPPFCPTTPAERRAVDAFQNEIIDRLFMLNATRAEEERKQGLVGGKNAGGKTGRRQRRSGAEVPEQGELELG